MASHRQSFSGKDLERTREKRNQEQVIEIPGFWIEETAYRRTAKAEW
jgi:hypothetical protein